MALSSPGVEVTISDDSQSLPAAANSVPLVLLATAENKSNPSGTGIAAGTTAANAGKLFRVTSQRDLVNLYGNPFFYTGTDGSPLQGYELNEYGLLAAYSALGISNTVFCMRADVDLDDLEGQIGRPSGAPANNSLWLDTSITNWGIFEFNSVTGQFTSIDPIVVTDENLVSNGLPLNSLGSPGAYAVIAIPTYNQPTATNAKQYFYKVANNTWVSIGSQQWLTSTPTIRSSNTNPVLTEGDTFVIGLGTGSAVVTATITVPASTNNNVAGIAAAINALGWGHLSAQVASGRLVIFSSQTGDSNTFYRFVRIASGTGTVLADLGIDTGDYNQPGYFYGKSSQQPLWQAGQTSPRPSGSVWIKVGAAGNGLAPSISKYSAVQNAWQPQLVTLAIADWEANSLLDSAGGLNIPAGTLYAQYNYNGEYAKGPVYYWEKTNAGPTVVTGSINNPVFSNGPYVAIVRVSQPGSSALSEFFVVTLADGASATDFVTAWGSAGISNTTASINPDGAIVITHELGGVIVVTSSTGNVMQDAGFTSSNVNVKDKLGLLNVPGAQTSTSGTGTNFSASVIINIDEYVVDATTFNNAGTGYAVGDTITIAGTNLNGVSPANDLVVRVTQVDAGVVEGIAFVSGTPAPVISIQLTPWAETPFDIVAQSTAPTAIPANGTNWFYSVVDQVDIMVNFNGVWRGYNNQNYDSNGFPTPTGVNATNPTGPIISASEPGAQTDDTPLEYGDLWIDTSDLENYPVINRWQSVLGVDKWVRLDNTNQIDPSGVLFADARWGASGNVNPVTDAEPTIVSLLDSNFTDLDRPDPSLFPVGMLLFNTRRSGYNVKEFRKNYFSNANFPDQALPTEKDAWVSASGLQSTGAPFMGRKAQRAMVVKALRATIDTNTAIRDEDNFFNLIAAPGYPELQSNMIALNSDRGETAFIVGDTPLRLADDATAIQDWATNAAGAASTGEDGLVTRNSFMGLFYPSGLTNDLSGNQVVVPASHMMLRTLIRNDAVAYPWFAPAGTRRGIIDNATSIGYLDARTGEFQTTRTRVGIRDVCYTNQINPLVFFTGNGLLNYGNKSSFDSISALDRINVARLVAYIRRQLTIVARPFVFEPNDQITREQITSVIQTLFVDLVAKRGLSDYLVVCDESNNTPARIDRNELYVDIAIEPIKAAEFIFIPVRVLNTGELTGQ